MRAGLTRYLVQPESKRAGMVALSSEVWKFNSTGPVSGAIGPLTRESSPGLVSVSPGLRLWGQSSLIPF